MSKPIKCNNCGRNVEQTKEGWRHKFTKNVNCSCWPKKKAEPK